ncbi:MAG TPA: GAF domain-containing sensor histidine kinase [Phycisphaerae bacterium]|nr:GAF domain-containing sensor histidine kinase [Phycisphaerae bacterium]
MALEQRKQVEAPQGRLTAPAPPATDDRQALRALVQVSQMVAGNLDLADVLRSSIHAAAEAMNAEACSILLRDPEADALRFHIVDGPQTRGLSSAALPIDDHSIAGWVARHQEPVLIPDAYRDARFNRDYDLRTGFRTKSILCAPLISQEHQVGVMQILNRRDGRAFDEYDLVLSQAVASLIAVAIRNAEEHEARIKAERLATIGQTIAGMAHCVKNILNGLRAGSYIIDQQMADDDDSKVARGWKIVKKNMMLLSNIVMDMLSYSKERKPLYQPCRIGDLCEDIVGLLQQQAADRGVTLVTGSDLDAVCVDESGLRRCLINLVGNAIDACSAGGGLVKLEAVAADADDRFILRVRDNGCGMEPEAREKIFNAFFSTKGGKGTGLGLAVTKKIVEEHGGEIRVESVCGEGTEFTLVLPVKPAGEPTD